MVKVPEYQSDVSLRPIFQSGVDVRANAEHMGAAVGRGMQGAARGMEQLAGSLQQVQALEDATRAKEADNNYSNWMRERMYGEGGFMTLEGRNAIDQRAAFEKEAEAKRKDFGSKLTPGASQAYSSASQARLQSTLQQSIVHTANARKQWFNDASNARVETFANDAMANYGNPAIINKNIGAAVLELQEQAQMHGWAKEKFDLAKGELVSSIHNNVALRIAQDDPIAADNYIKSIGDGLTPSAKFDLTNKLREPIYAAKGLRNAAEILGGVATERYDGDGSVISPTGRRSAADDDDGAISMEPATKTSSDAVTRTPLPTGPQSFQSVASQFVGMHEATNGKVIADFIKRSSGISIDPKRTAWCAAFVNGVLGAQGIEGTGKLNARSFMNFGTATDNPKPGDIVVLSRGAPGSGKGHVGFFQGYDANGNIRILGGNQGDSVNVSAYSPDRLLGFRSAGRVSEGAMALPNYSPVGLGAISERLAAISDPREAEATRKAIDAQLTLQKKAMDQQQEQVKSWATQQVMTDPAIDLMKLPLEMQTALGTEGMTSLLNYQEKVRSQGEPTTDDRVLFELQDTYAMDPAEFAEIDLFQYRDKLANSDWEKVRGWRQTALTDKRKAREEGGSITSAMSQATNSLEGVGISATNLKGTMRDDANRRVASFQRALTSEMEDFKQVNERVPNQVEVQSMINRLLLPVVMKTPGALWGENTWRPDGIKGDTFLFETRNRPDNATVDVAVEYSSIPVDLRFGIANDLERELGRKPTEDEVVQRYEEYALNR